MLSEKIIRWYHQNKRELPWRQTRNPYFIWLSEIILQQTRIDQGLPYYLAFVEKFPTVFILANSEESDVLRTWQGLGYYSRARNLHQTAKYVVNQYDGVFPSDYSGLLKLKGIGPYTAAAIASISYNEPRAVVDGNVYRVLSRLYEIQTPINSSLGIKQFSELAQSLVSVTNTGDYNQGLMEIGANICTPRNPNCQSCPVESSCKAKKNNSQHEFPVKLKKAKIKDRFFNYLVIKSDDNYFLNRRNDNDIWKGLFEFFLIETSKSISHLDSIKDKFPKWLNEKLEFGTPSKKNQILSHQKIHAQFWPISIPKKVAEMQDSFYSLEEIEKLPKHRLVEKYLLDNTI